MQIVSYGEDSLGKFKVNLPGICDHCQSPVDVSMRYTSASSLASHLDKLGIQYHSASLLVSPGNKELGITCGCYAKFQRQIAHIGRKRTPNPGR